MDQHPKRSLRRRKNEKDVKKKLRKKSSQPQRISAVTPRTAEQIILAPSSSSSNKRRSKQVGSLATSCVPTPLACDTDWISSTGSLSLQESSQIICRGIFMFEKMLHWAVKLTHNKHLILASQAPDTLCAQFHPPLISPPLCVASYSGPATQQVSQVEVVTYQDPRKKLKTKQTAAPDPVPVSLQ